MESGKSYFWTAKIFIYANGQFHKMITYHNIDTRNNKWQERLERYCIKNFVGLHHINYYGGIPSTFQFQQKFYETKSI